jgi:hypothetical protein
MQCSTRTRTYEYVDCGIKFRSENYSDVMKTTEKNVTLTMPKEQKKHKYCMRSNLYDLYSVGTIYETVLLNDRCLCM